MKNFIYYTALVAVLTLTGCISTSYHGKSYTATKELAIYYSRADLPKGDYQTIGELKVTADTICSSESMIKKIREESMARGADIAIISWFDSRFFNDKHQHIKSCRTSHCHPEKKDKYKYKKLVKVILLRNN